MKIPGTHLRIVEQIVTCLNVASGYPELHEGNPENRNVETLQVGQAFEQLGITQLAGLIRAAVLEADRREPRGSTRLRETLRQHVFWPSCWTRKADSIAEACCRIPPDNVKCEVAITGVRVGFTSPWLSGTVLFLGSKQDARASVEQMSAGGAGYCVKDTDLASGDSVEVVPIASVSPGTTALCTNMRDLVLRTARFHRDDGELCVFVGCENAITAFATALLEHNITIEEECEILIATGTNVRLVFKEGSPWESSPAPLVTAVRLRRVERQEGPGAELQEGGLEP